MKKWNHAKTILEDEKHEINGLNIWDHPWVATGDTIHIKDPIYHQDFTFKVYRIEDNKLTIEFAAGEFSNGVWGIYESGK